MFQQFSSLSGCAEYGFHQKAISYKAEEQFYNRLLQRFLNRHLNYLKAPKISPFVFHIENVDT